MEPYVALMRRYCIDYTSAHDQSLTAELMSPEYAITISGRTMGMDDYTAAVSAAYRRYPTLVITVHDIMLSGDRLAMRFSEHGAAADDPDNVAVWPGLSLYRWDGSQLLTCRVEQDFLGRDEQTASGRTAPLEPPHPWPPTASTCSSAAIAPRCWPTSGSSSTTCSRPGTGSPPRSRSRAPTPGASTGSGRRRSASRARSQPRSSHGWPTTRSPRCGWSATAGGSSVGSAGRSADHGPPRTSRRTSWRTSWRTWRRTSWRTPQDVTDPGPLTAPRRRFTFR